MNNIEQYQSMYQQSLYLPNRSIVMDTTTNP